MASLISQFLGNTSSKSNVTVEMASDTDSIGSFVTLITNDNFYPGVDALCKSVKATSTGTSDITVSDIRFFMRNDFG